MHENCVYIYELYIYEHLATHFVYILGTIIYNALVCYFVVFIVITGIAPLGQSHQSQLLMAIHDLLGI